jgi:hypothetical protein
MNYLSYKQELFRDYLIKKIGFVEDDFLKNYVSILGIISPKLKLLGKQNKIWSEDEKKFLPENYDPENTYKKYTEKDHYFIPDKFNIIDFLNIEVDLKKKFDFGLKQVQLNFISATDISNFTYCPISFAISKTFELPKLESAILGTSQHEKHTLINYLIPSLRKANTSDKEQTLSFNPFLNEENQLFFEELNNSSIIFYGRESKENKNKYFKNVSENFVGQPDYIFKNETTNEIFVVEEKFQF